MKVLIADDNHFYRRALEATLVELGYEVTAVADGEAAWEVLRGDHAPRIAVLDWMMPRLDGLGVCRRLRATPRPEPTYVIMLSSRDGKADVVTALENGADDFVTKPFDRAELAARLRVGRRIVTLQTAETVIYSFARAVDGKSRFTSGHSDRVQGYALALAGQLGLTPADADLLRRGAALHDIGKIAVPDAVLNKPGPLTPDEQALVREHPAQGVRMIEAIESVRDTVPLVRWHHERMDGTGYPDRLPGDRIPFLVRVLAVADVYDALHSDRPYRAALPREVCLPILRKDAVGGGLDPELVEEFCAIPADRLAGVGSGAWVRPGDRTPLAMPAARGALAPA